MSLQPLAYCVAQISLPRFVHARRGIQRAPRRHSSAGRRCGGLACLVQFCQASCTAARGYPGAPSSQNVCLVRVFDLETARRATGNEKLAQAAWPHLGTRNPPRARVPGAHRISKTATVIWQMTARRPRGASRARPSRRRCSVVPPLPAPLSLSRESNRHGTHIGEKTPRLWYIVEVDLYITTYVFRLVLVGMGRLAGFPGPSPTASGGGQGRRPLVLAP